MDIGELNSLYQDAESCDSELFSEMRSNLLLVAGNHYAKRGSRFWNTLRRVDTVSKNQKIRLTKNHIQKITKTYENNILSFAPGVSITARNEGELKDQKAAELNNSVWQDLRRRHKIKKLKRNLTKDFVEIGEMVMKVFYDPNAGALLGYEPVLDEAGMPLLDEATGEPKHVTKMSGDLIFERVLGFNLLRDKEAKSWEENRWVCIRKMVEVKALKARYKDDEERLGFIQESSKRTFQVFDGNSGSYKSGDGMVMVREFYFRACDEYPEGYYYIATEDGILHEGALPLGLFPILYAGFDEVATSARSHSIIKQLRPYQAEVNRSASKIAEHQVTLGDDKLILPPGGSITPGGTAHGIKAVKVAGGVGAFHVITGRNGAQFLEYMNGQISEMYNVANVAEDSVDVKSQLDPYTMLFRSIKEKKKFVLYGEKVEEFDVEMCMTALRLAKAYFPEEMMVPVFGKNEAVNIAEWKATDDLGHQITIEPQTEDVESKMGRQLTLNHIFQYSGQNMKQEDMGRLIRAMPYVNKEEMFSDLTIDYDNATSDILALDRGEQVPAEEDDNHQYMVKRLTHRIKQNDFKFLPPQVQQMYRQRKTQHQQFIKKQLQDDAASKAGFIPSGGYLVSCDFYLPDQDPTKQPKRARIPMEAVQWLLKRLETQGSTQKTLEQVPISARGGVAPQVDPRLQLGPTADPTGMNTPPPPGAPGMAPPSGGAVSQQTLNAAALAWRPESRQPMPPRRPPGMPVPA